MIAGLAIRDRETRRRPVRSAVAASVAALDRPRAGGRVRRPMIRALQIGCVWPSEHGGGGDRVFADLARYLPGQGIDLEALFAGPATGERPAGVTLSSFGSISDGTRSRWMKRAPGDRDAGGLGPVRSGRVALRALRLGGRSAGCSGCRMSSTSTARGRPSRVKKAPAGCRRCVEVEHRTRRLSLGRPLHRAVAGLRHARRARLRRAAAADSRRARQCRSRAVPHRAQPGRRPRAAGLAGRPAGAGLGAAAGPPHRRRPPDRCHAGGRGAASRRQALRRRHRPAAAGATPARARSAASTTPSPSWATCPTSSCRWSTAPPTST